MQAFFSNECRLTQRATCPLQHCVYAHPGFLKPYFGQLLNALHKPGVHNALIRNITRLLQEVTIPKKFHGKLMTACFDFISSEVTPIAVKAFALTILHNLSGQYPEIAPELKLVIEERFERETPAFKSRARKILKQLD